MTPTRSIDHRPSGAISTSRTRTEYIDGNTCAVMTKQTLATLSHAVESIAAAAGDGATVISLFQRGSYFARMSARYEQMVASGSTVVVAYAGDGPTVAGAHHVTLPEDHPLTGEWAIILIAPDVAAHVCGEDLVDFDPTATDLESGRRFQASFGYDRLIAADHAQWLLSELAPMMESDVVDQVEQAIRTTRHAPTSVCERSMSVAAGVLAVQLERTQRNLANAITRLASETELATHDPLTGLLNREGLERWLGGTEAEGLAMPPMGVVLIDLDGFKQINDTHGHAVGDRILVAVATAILGSSRSSDVPARWGGDEFIVLCPDTTDGELGSIAECIVGAIANVDVDGTSITASAGTQTCSTRPLSLELADRALYAAKGNADRALAIDVGGAPTVSPDGRVARRQRNRERVVDAYVRLLTEGVAQPSASELAALAEVTPRTVYRYMHDDSTLRTDVAERLVPALQLAFTSDGSSTKSLRDRIDVFVAHRRDAYEQIAPILHIVRSHLTKEPVAMMVIETVVATLKDHFITCFAPELERLALADRRAELSSLQTLVLSESLEQFFNSTSNEVDGVNPPRLRETATS